MADTVSFAASRLRVPQIAVRDVGMTDLTDLVGVLQPRLVPGIGAIAAKYAALGGAGGFLGAAAGGHSPTPGGTGWFRTSRAAPIYWSAETGAHEVHGAIREKWAALGWERSFLGFPAHRRDHDARRGRPLQPLPGRLGLLVAGHGRPRGPRVHP
jgi:hypothetical protein